MTTSNETCDPRMVSRHLYDNAKWWNGFSSLLTLLGFAAGVVAVIELVPTKPVPFVVAALAIIGEVSGHFARSRYAAAEWLQRKLDMRDSLGLQLSRKEWTDFLARCPGSVRSKSYTETSDDTFFASQEHPGARKAFQNLMESSWWSKHLSETMCKLYFAIVIVATLGSIVALIVSLEVAPLTNQAGQTSRDILSKVSNVVTSVLMLVISLRLIETAFGFVQFARDSDLSETAAETALATNPEDGNAASRLWHEYQVSRATAPILPTWVWKLRQKDLNTLWNEHRKQ